MWDKTQYLKSILKRECAGIMLDDCVNVLEHRISDHSYDKDIEVDPDFNQSCHYSKWNKKPVNAALDAK